MNSSKRKAGGLLDPLLVELGWFEVSLPDLQLRLSSRVPEEHRAVAQDTIKRLHLVHDERVMRQRRRWYEMYQRGEVSLDGLRRNAPLIAEAIERETARV